MLNEYEVTIDQEFPLFPDGMEPQKACYDFDDVHCQSQVLLSIPARLKYRGGELPVRWCLEDSAKYREEVWNTHDKSLGHKIVTTDFSIKERFDKYLKGAYGSFHWPKLGMDKNQCSILAHTPIPEYKKFLQQFASREQALIFWVIAPTGVYTSNSDSSTFEDRVFQDFDHLDLGPLPSSWLESRWKKDIDAYYDEMKNSFGEETANRLWQTCSGIPPSFGLQAPFETAKLAELKGKFTFVQDYY